jgi:hypothetical protein
MKKQAKKLSPESLKPVRGGVKTKLKAGLSGNEASASGALKTIG